MVPHVQVQSYDLSSNLGPSEDDENRCMFPWESITLSLESRTRIDNLNYTDPRSYDCQAAT